MPSSDIPHFYPNARQVFLKLIADRKTRKIVGAQAVGPGEGVKRIDVLATAMTFGATVDDLPSIDLGYAPPYATAIDIAAHAANVLRNKIEGVALYPYAHGSESDGGSGRRFCLAGCPLPR